AGDAPRGRLDGPRLARPSARLETRDSPQCRGDGVSMSEQALAWEDIRQVITDVMDRRHFVTSFGFTLDLNYLPAETLPWEVFRGQLVPPHLTRQTRTFGSWNVTGQMNDSPMDGEPLLSIKLDPERGELHVVRALLCYVWEGYDAGGNVIESRE